MGHFVDGEWVADDWSTVANKEGAFVRPKTAFHAWIRADGSSGFEAEPGRYHLYVSYACPWAHRTLIMRTLKGLEDAISISVVDPFMDQDGWRFGEAPGSIPDTVNGTTYLREIYAKASPSFSGRVTVPVLWDKRSGPIVNNESAEIIRMFDAEFGRGGSDFYPPELRAEIDSINERVYETVNNGVYKCGFAQTQEAYEAAFDALFATLDDLEARLEASRYVAGSRLTEADWRVFPTLVRFDAVYYTHFKCNLRRIEDYTNLSNYLRELYQVPGVAATVNLKHIKQHYFGSHESINPRRIVAKGPALDFSRPHDRARLAGEALALAG
jgi:putative glutathione S-transferase